MPKHELNKNATNKHAIVDEGKPSRTQPYAKNYRELSRTGSGRDGPTQGKAHPLGVQCQKVSPENTYK